MNRRATTEAGESDFEVPNATSSTTPLALKNFRRDEKKARQHRPDGEKKLPGHALKSEGGIGSMGDEMVTNSSLESVVCNWEYEGVLGSLGRPQRHVRGRIPQHSETREQDRRGVTVVLLVLHASRATLASPVLEFNQPQ